MVAQNLRMLCYRQWLESRTRFYIAVALLVLIVVYSLLYAKSTIEEHPQLHAGRVITFTQYVWVIIYKGYFLTVFTLSSFLFGVGSPRQEKNNGTAPYSLALPVQRKVFVYSKITLATIQVILLSLLMAFVIPIVAILFGFQYPIKDALLFSVLISTAGLIFMVFGFLLSILVNSEMVIIPLGTATLAAIFFISRLPALEYLNIFNFMTGAGYLSNENFLFDQPLNFIGISILLFLYFTGSRLSILIFKRMDI